MLRRKKAAIEMSFQFLFSVILIIVVVLVGFIVIRMFLKQAEKVKFLDFVNTIKETCIDVWDKDASSQLVISKINRNVQYVCFANASRCNQNYPGYNGPQTFCAEIQSFYLRTGKNMFYYPLEIAKSYGLESGYEITCSEQGQQIKRCLNLTNAVCIPVYSGLIKLRIEKESENSLIKIRQA